MARKIEWTHEATAELRLVSTFHREPIQLAVERLSHQADVETRNRKPLIEPLEALPGATWEVRVGDYRVFYRIDDRHTVTVLQVIFKGTSTTAGAIGRGRIR